MEKPAGVLIGFASEDDWFDYKLEHDPRFLARIAGARKNLEKGKGIRIEDLSTVNSSRLRTKNSIIKSDEIWEVSLF